MELEPTDVPKEELESVPIKTSSCLGVNCTNIDCDDLTCPISKKWNLVNFGTKLLSVVYELTNRAQGVDIPLHKVESTRAFAQLALCKFEELFDKADTRLTKRSRMRRDYYSPSDFASYQDTRAVVPTLDVDTQDQLVCAYCNNMLSDNTIMFRCGHKGMHMKCVDAAIQTNKTMCCPTCNITLCVREAKRADYYNVKVYMHPDIKSLKETKKEIEDVTNRLKIQTISSRCHFCEVECGVDQQLLFDCSLHVCCYGCIEQYMVLGSICPKCHKK